MKEVGRSSLSRILRGEQGQIIWWLPLLMIVFFGMAGLTLDLGRAYVAYRELQASTDAAALAGAWAMTSVASTASITNTVSSYSSVTGGYNVSNNLPGAAVTTTYECISDNPNVVPAKCNAFPSGYNVLQVMQTSTVPMYFIRMLSLFGLNPGSGITLRAYATATGTSGKNTKVNVAVVLDSTNSMSQTDGSSACPGGESKEACALNGVQQLLGELTPCTNSKSCSSTAFDTVSLFTFPNVAANATQYDTSSSSCSTRMPSSDILPYTAPTVPTSSTTSWTAPTGSSGTYQLTGYLNDYSSNNQYGGSVSSSSNLGVATGAGSCSGIQPIGGSGTYLPGAIYAAQTSLMAQSYNSPGSQNVIIVLSDGDQNTTRTNFGSTPSFSYTDSTGFSSTYPSTANQCHQAVAAANYAKTLGTTIYTVGYGASNQGYSKSGGGSCNTDQTQPISGCTELADMASSSANFFSFGGSCSGGSSSLNSIFSTIGSQLTTARLIPNGTT